MFGYISPQKNELKVKELALYNAYYCGLCKTIGCLYGEAARLSLSYDCSFLAILLDGLGDCPGCKPARCAYKPLAKPRPVVEPNEALRFAARWNVLLAWYKAQDDREDENSLKGALGKAAFAKGRGRAEKECPGLEKAIRAGIEALSALEKQGCGELDRPASAFGEMMRDCMAFAPAPDERARKVLSAIAYHMGKWIYLADAWEDRERDARTGAYNPFNAAGAKTERASFLLHYSLNEAVKAYELLELRSNRGILDNIFYIGCGEKTQALLGGKDGQSL